MLSINELRELKRNDFDAVVMAAGMESFSELIKSYKSEALFHHINEKLNDVIPLIKEYGGIVYQYHGGSFNACFMDGAEEALRSGMKVCRRMHTTDKNAISLCTGDIMSGLLGCNGDEMPAVISEATGLSEYLAGITQKYSTKIMATGSFCGRIEDFDKRFINRFLGYIFIRSKKTYEKLYDIFQADEEEIFWMKRKTKLMFEEGVRLYSGFKYKMARKHFIEVLKIYREDNASKYYLHLCDYCLKFGTDIRRRIYIEEY